MSAYLDYNATTPLDERVLEAMLPWLAGPRGNPSSIHASGRRAREAVETAREQVAVLVGSRPAQVVFTSGGTEAANLAIKGVCTGCGPGRLAVTATEHPCVLEPARQLGHHGWTVDTVPVTPAGVPDPGAMEEALARGPRLVAAMWANNETGVVSDIPAVAARARAGGSLVFADAVQAVGKIPVDFDAAGLHLMGVSAHKLYGPQGVGALVVDPAVALEPLLAGGGQERGRRSGTESVAAIVGFGRAAEVAVAELESRRRRLSELRQRLETAVTAISGVQVVAAAGVRLPNTSLLLVPGIEGETLAGALDGAGYAISSGSACASGKGRGSHVLTAMGLVHDAEVSAVRVSVGAATTVAEVDGFCAALRAVVGQFQRLAVMAGNG